MSQNKQSNTIIKVIVWVVIFIIVAIATYFCFVNFMPSEVEQIEATEATTSTTENIIEDDGEKVILADSDVVKEGGVVVRDESDPNNSYTVTGTITNARAVGDIYRISIMTDQSLSYGTCNLTMTQGDDEVTSTSEITAHPHSASCVFDLGLDKISSGTWNINIEVLTDYGYSGIISDVIEVEK